MKVLATISTRGRYFTTLPLAIQSVAFQSEKPDALYLFDDNEEPQDLLKYDLYKYLFMQLDIKGIPFKLFFGRKSGQHFNHQWANEIAKDEKFDAIWRLDDDTAPEPDTLKIFKSYLNDLEVGAVGSSILTPPIKPIPLIATGDIRRIKIEPNMQWGIIKEHKEVDHLHCSYLHKVGISDYNLNLSMVAHREETLHTWGFRLLGYKCLLVPSDGCTTWHYKNSEGGIRSTNNADDYVRDERVFEDELGKDGISVNWKLVVLDNGFGDHWAFKHILQKLKLKHKNIMVACCYPDIFSDENVDICSIQHIKDTFGDIDRFNIYKFMEQSYHKGGLISAFEKMYL
jgi:hypothetical protein